MPIVKIVSVPIKVSGAKDAELAIGRVNVAAKELGASDPTIKIKVDAQRAILEARIARAGITAELAKAGAGDGGGGGGGLLGRLLFGGDGSGDGGGGAGFRRALAKYVSLGQTAGGAATLLTAGGGSVAALVGAAGVLSAISGIPGDLAAAGLAVGAFGALAMPTFTAISGAISATSTATSNYQTASQNLNIAIRKRVTALSNNKAALSGLLPDQKAALTALLAQRDAWNSLSTGQQKVVTGWQKVSSTFSSMAAKLAPDVLKILGSGLQAANKFLPSLLPLAQAAVGPIDGLLKRLGSFAGSPGFSQFVAQMSKLSGPAITAIGDGIGKLSGSLGNLLLTMSGPKGIRAINDTFNILDGVIKTTDWAMRGLPHSWDRVTGAFREGWRNMIRWSGEGGTAVGKSFTPAMTAVQALQKADKTVRITGDISNLQAKIAEARKDLADKRLTRPQAAFVRADIGALTDALNVARGELAALTGTAWNVNVTSTFQPLGSLPGQQGMKRKASGGWASGWTLAGEQGPELMYTPGSQVYTAPQTAAMLSGRTGGSHYTINLYQLVASRDTGRQVVEAIKQFEQGSGASWRKP